MSVEARCLFCIPSSPRDQTGSEKKDNDFVRVGNSVFTCNLTSVPVISDEQSGQQNWHGGSCGPFASTVDECFSPIQVKYTSELSHPVFQSWVNSFVQTLLWCLNQAHCSAHIVVPVHGGRRIWIVFNRVMLAKATRQISAKSAPASEYWWSTFRKGVCCSNFHWVRLAVQYFIRL